MTDGTRRQFLALGVTAAFAVRADAADTVGTGIIGVGNRGSYLLRTIIAEPRARVAAICDIKPDRLDRAATLAAASKPATTADYRQLLQRKDIDAVFIASPCDLHVEMSIAALRAGKHVYCEKPIGITPESVRELIRAAREARTVYMVGLQRRSDNGLREVVSKIHDGVAGRVVMIKAQRHATNDFSPSGSSGDWIFDARRSGDVIVEQAIHNLDVCNWILKSRPEKAAGFGGALLSPGNPPGRTITDGYTLSFEYPNNTKMSFTQVAFHPPQLPFGGEQTYIYGSEGAVALESGTFYPRSKEAKPQVLAERKRENREAVHIGKFYDSIQNGTRPETDVIVGATATLTAILGREAMYRGKVLSWKELGVEL
jgi:predicted dehydrogenase